MSIETETNHFISQVANHGIQTGNWGAMDALAEMQGQQHFKLGKPDIFPFALAPETAITEQLNTITSEEFLQYKINALESVFTEYYQQMRKEGRKPTEMTLADRHALQYWRDQINTAKEDLNKVREIGNNELPVLEGKTSPFKKLSSFMYGF